MASSFNDSPALRLGWRTLKGSFLTLLTFDTRAFLPSTATRLADTEGVISDTSHLRLNLNCRLFDVFLV